eukprot:1161658-Pelagomonas_calceolata.AAC.2
MHPACTPELQDCSTTALQALILATRLFRHSNCSIWVSPSSSQASSLAALKLSRALVGLELRPSGFHALSSAANPRSWETTWGAQRSPRHMREGSRSGNYRVPSANPRCWEAAWGAQRSPRRTGPSCKPSLLVDHLGSTAQPQAYGLCYWGVQAGVCLVSHMAASFLESVSKANANEGAASIRARLDPKEKE